MTLSVLNGQHVRQTHLDWAELSLSVNDASPDPLIFIQPFGEGMPRGGVRIIASDATTARFPRALLGSIVSLIGAKTDETKAYIDLGVDLNNDVELTLTAVDETGGGAGGGTGDQAHIAGTVTIDGVAASRQIVIVDDDPAGRKLVGTGQSATDGTFDIAYDDTGFAVVAIALDEYGAAFAAETALNQGEIIHPTTPNGYVYEVSVAGTTGTSEPTWSTTESVQSGSVTFNPKPYYRPVASGPLKGDPVTPTPIMATESGSYMITESGNYMIVE